MGRRGRRAAPARGPASFSDGPARRRRVEERPARRAGSIENSSCRSDYSVRMRTRPGSLVAIALMLATATPSPSVAAQVGEIAFVNSDAAAAQARFLAATAQRHNFEYAAAAELFRAAQQLDPGFAMAYWGEAMTYNHAVWMEQDLSAARKALARLAPTREGRA